MLNQLVGVFKARGKKQARQYGNIDQKRLIYSLNNVDRQLKEVTDNANKNMANSNFLFLKETSGNTRWCHS